MTLDCINPPPPGFKKIEFFLGFFRVSGSKLPKIFGFRVKNKLNFVEMY